MSEFEHQTVSFGQGPQAPFGAMGKEELLSGDEHFDRLCQLIRRLSDPAGLSTEMRWKLAARGVTIEVLRECLDIVADLPGAERGSVRLA